MKPRTLAEVTQEPQPFVDGRPGIGGGRAGTGGGRARIGGGRAASIILFAEISRDSQAHAFNRKFDRGLGCRASSLCGWPATSEIVIVIVIVTVTVAVTVTVIVIVNSIPQTRNGNA